MESSEELGKGRMMDRTQEAELEETMAYAVIAKALDTADPADCVTYGQYMERCQMLMALAGIEATDVSVKAFRDLVRAKWDDVNVSRLDETLGPKTNVTYRHVQDAELCYRRHPNLGLLSITIDGVPSAALAIAEGVDDGTIYSVLFVAPTDAMDIRDMDGGKAMAHVETEKKIEARRAEGSENGEE